MNSMMKLIVLWAMVVVGVSGLGYYGADIPGNDIGTTNTDSDLNCAIACDNNPSCNAWSWDNTGSGTCWLKSVAGDRVAVDNRVYGVKLGEPVDRSGGDMPDMPLSLGYATPASCAAQCQATSGCVAWAFDTCGQSSCWLKDTLPTSTSPNSCRVSAVQGTFNIDHPGSDISNSNLPDSATATDCHTQCLNTPGCNAWTMVQPGVGCSLENTCWLKSSGTAATDTNDCCMSGVLSSSSGGSGSNSGSSGGSATGSSAPPPTGPLNTLTVVNNVNPCAGGSYSNTITLFWTNYAQGNLAEGSSQEFQASQIPNTGLGIQENGEYCRCCGDESGCDNPDNAGMQLVLNGPSGGCENFQLNDPFYCGAHPPNAKTIVSVQMSGDWPNCVATLTRLPGAPNCQYSC